MMKKQSLNNRRQFLKLGTGTALAAAGATVGGLAATPAQAAATGLCVRSPWAHYPLDSAATGANLEALSTGNETLDSLLPLTPTADQWTTVPGWWQGNGIDRALEAVWPQGSAFDGMLLPDGGAYLVGVEVVVPTIPTLSETIFQIGHRSTAAGLNGLHLKVNTIGKPTVSIGDGSTTELLVAGKDVIPSAAASQACLFVYIDQRAAGSRTMGLYQYASGTEVQSNRVDNIAFLGGVNGGDGTARYITVGARRANNGALQQFYSGQLRGLHIINFGQTPPTNMNAIMAGLSLGGMQPGTFLDSV